MKNIIYSLALVFSLVVLTSLTDDPPKIPPTISLESPNDPYFWVRFDTTATDTTHRMFVYMGEYGWIALADSMEIWDNFVPYRSAKDTLITAYPIKSTQFIADTTFTPSGTEELGSIYWDDDNKTFSGVLENGVIGQFFEEAFIPGQNNTGSTLQNGTVATFLSEIGNSGNIRIGHTVASASESPILTIGIITQDILDGNSGKVTTRGRLRKIPTNGAIYGETWLPKDILYKSPTIAGGLTNIPPEAPIPAIPIAVVITAHATNGTLLVRPTFPTSMQMLSDVNGTELTTKGQFPVWDEIRGVFDFDYNLWGFDTGLIQNKPYDATWAVEDSTTASKAQLHAKISEFENADYCPNSTVVDRGTLTAGSLSNLCLKDGLTATIQELSGADPLRITFTFTDVIKMSFFNFYGQYNGGASHVLYAEIYNPITLTWEHLGEFGIDGIQRWHSFPIFIPDTYISSGTVQTRIVHQGNGIPSHNLILDYVEVAYGGGGGGSSITASTVEFTPTGDISATNVQAAITELDTEKVAKVASTDNALPRFNGTGGDIQNSGVELDDSDNIKTTGYFKGAALKLTGTSTGLTTISSANTSATDYTVTVPARTLAIDNITTGTTTDGTGFVKGDGSVISFDNTTYEPTLTKGNLTAASTKVAIGGTGTGALIGAGASVDINEGNIVHQNLSGAGTNTHTQIDTHIGSTSNPHSVTYTQTGAAPASGSANYVQVSPASAQLGNINMNGIIKLGSLSDRSGLSQILIADSVTGGVSSHCVADNNIVELSGVGYNSFDSKPIFSGTSSYDHAVAFQSIPEYASDGNAGILYGMFNRFTHIGSGIIDTGIGIYLGAHSGTGLFNNVYGIITQQGAGNSGFGIETPRAQVHIDSNGLTSLPATSGTIQSSGVNTRFSAQSKTSAILDFGTNGSDGFWMQSTDFTDLSQKYPLLLNPNGGGVSIAGKVKIMPLSSYYGEQIQINEIAPKVTYRADGGYYWSAGVSSSANDAKYVIRYESDSKDVLIIDRLYNVIIPSLYGTGTRLTTASATGQLGSLSYSDFISNNGVVTGSLTSGYIPVATGSSSLGNSSIYDDGTNVGIGTTGPGAKLDVRGTIQSLVDGGQPEIRLMRSTGEFGAALWNNVNGTTDYLAFGVGHGTAPNLNEKMRILDNGNVGINKPDPATALDVNGTTTSSLFKMTNGAALGYLPVSSADGTMTWTAPSTVLSGYATESWVGSNYDDYNAWALSVNGVALDGIYSGNTVDFVAGTGISLGYSSRTVTIAATGGGSGTVTSVAQGAGMSFSTITSSGSVALATPLTLTASTTNSAGSAGSGHSHAITGFLPLTGGTVASGVAQTVQTISAGSTFTFNYNNGANAAITLSATITSATFSNIPDGGTGYVAIIEDATGGWRFDLTNISASGLTVYVYGTQPVNQNFGSNGKSLMHYIRLGSYLYVAYPAV